MAIFWPCAQSVANYIECGLFLVRNKMEKQTLRNHPLHQKRLFLYEKKIRCLQKKLSSFRLPEPLTAVEEMLILTLDLETMNGLLLFISMEF